MYSVPKSMWIGNVILIALAGLMPGESEARDWRPERIPNGSEAGGPTAFTQGCINCHVSALGGGARNAFGADVLDRINALNILPSDQFQPEPFWDNTLATMDSDLDGFTNGEELQDPTGAFDWMDDDPGNPALVTLPGDATSFPPAPTIDAQPSASDATPDAGGTVTITSGASGVATSLQWQFRATPLLKGAGFMDLTDGGNISGANTDTLVVSSVVFGDSGRYRLVATNPAGTTTSGEAEFLVNGATVNVPTLSEWGRILMLAMLFGAGAVALARRRKLQT